MGEKNIKEEIKDIFEKGSKRPDFKIMTTFYAIMFFILFLSLAIWGINNILEAFKNKNFIDNLLAGIFTGNYSSCFMLLVSIFFIVITFIIIYFGVIFFLTKNKNSKNNKQ